MYIIWLRKEKQKLILILSGTKIVKPAPSPFALNQLLMDGIITCFLTKTQTNVNMHFHHTCQHFSKILINNLNYIPDVTLQTIVVNNFIRYLFFASYNGNTFFTAVSFNSKS